MRRALAETTEVVLGIADAEPSPKPTSLNLLVSDGRLLAACRHGRTLHVASEAAPRHVFAVASEPIGPGPWEQLAEGGFVGTEDGLRVERSALFHGHSSPAIGKPRG